jgi:purine nucleoside permease
MNEELWMTQDETNVSVFEWKVVKTLMVQSKKKKLENKEKVSRYRIHYKDQT